jgi:hypothetical protein
MMDDETTKNEAGLEPDPDLDLERAMHAFASERPPAGPTTGPRADADRETIELLGLIPYQLDPVTPSPSLERRVMAAVAAGRAEPSAGRAQPSARPAQPAVGRTPPASLPAPAIAGRGGVWMLRLAASLAVASLLFAGWLAVRMSAQSDTIAALERQLFESQQTAGAMAEAHSALRVELARITSPGVEVCPLRPMGEEPMQPRARALLFISEREGVWYLRVHDLDSPPDDRVYRLWFFGDDGPMSAGEVTASAGGPGGDRLVSGRLPEKGAMSRGVAVTLESDRETGAPRGPMVLFGDEKMNLL